MGEGDRPICRLDCAGEGAADPLNDERLDAGRSLGGFMEGVLITLIVGVGGAGPALGVGNNGAALVLGVAAVLDELIGGIELNDAGLVAAMYAASWSSFNSDMLVGATDSASLAEADPRRLCVGLPEFVAVVAALGVRECRTVMRLFFPTAWTSNEPRLVLIP